MVKVDFTEKEVRELRKFYVNELENIKERKREIHLLLRLLGHEPAEKTFPQTAREKTVSEDVDKFISPAHKTEPSILHTEDLTHQPRWGEYIIQKLKKNDRPLSMEQIFNAYQKENKVDLSKSRPAKTSLLQALDYLQTNENLIESVRRKGHRGQFYQLAKYLPAPVNSKRLPKKKKKAKPTFEKPEKQWIKFILDTLNKNENPLTRDELVEQAFDYFSIPTRHKISTRGKISKALTYMINETGQLKKTKKNGEAGVLFGLSGWFDKKNKLMQD